MTDLTVLISPVPLHPSVKPTFTFGRRTSGPVSRPIMVTLETEKEPEEEADDPTLDPTSPAYIPRSSRLDSSLLSPPLNTWKSRPRPRHRPTRSQSAPPERKSRKEEEEEEDKPSAEKPVELTPIEFAQPAPRKSLSEIPSNPSTRGGELIRPPPPLLRPTTFWRKTRRSGVSGPSYSPSSHLIRRSTFIAAGLSFDAPVHDLSALDTDESTVEFRTRHKWDINYRDVGNPIVDLLQTTSINWWPYPPDGGPASRPPPTTSTPLLVISVAPTSQPPVQPPPTSTVVTTSSNSTTNTTPSTGIITITALPPLDPTEVPTPIVQPKKSPRPEEQKFRLIYLAPVFVILGILWGSITAWFAYGCVTRRPKVRSDDELIGGPQYIPARPRDRDCDVENEGALLRDKMHEAVFSWPDLREKAMEARYQEEGDTFLEPPPPPSPSKSRSTRTKSARSTVTTYSDATYLQYTDDDDIPWESLRHKSIKRGILEEVHKEGTRIDALRPVSGTLLRNTGTPSKAKAVERKVSRHARTDSDVLVSEVSLPIPERTGTDSTNSSRGSGVDKTQWQPGVGFRIVDESPGPSREPTPAPPEEAHAANSFGMCWWGAKDVDRYTPLPTRHSSRSRSSSPTKPTTPGAGPVVSRSHRELLPQSPPQITSPLLEKELCFTPTPGRMLVATNTPAPTPVKAREKNRGRKLRSPSMPTLPFPVNQGGVNSPRPDMYRGKLVKSPAKRPPIAAKSVSAESRASYTRDAEGRAVMQKVEDIVQRGWGTSDLGEEGVRCLSPTGFGKRAA
ncbi:hypothetical protein H0H81_004326 [Sphagnurus paluster]|uniref:Uncharacterized protein n=1 Tax=Sphagnurus paluster TaxID=117069 RepID=A0A9P7K778_9AGAR|nr:hypothetical protein H0H81_004326 [Sphagnurus paluster]